jgi:hypothetical protein
MIYCSQTGLEGKLNYASNSSLLAFSLTGSSGGESLTVLVGSIVDEMLGYSEIISTDLLVAI